MANPPDSDEKDAKKPRTRRRSAPNSADLISFAKAARFQGIVESPEPLIERQTRLRIEEADAEQIRAQLERKATFEDWRERLLIKSGLAILIVVGTYCLVLNALPGESTERRSWATSTLTAIVGAFVGYVLGTSKK